MSKQLFNQVLAFDFDKTFQEYGFSTRLAKENKWTKNFTKQAILEYKKFMYLAATADAMVSPSEIVDIVWHQHLIFTRSYKDFCKLLGKKIEHIPSTHDRAEFEKFQQAKERTKKLYEKHFGKQPEAIWEARNMYDSMGLKKSKTELNTVIRIGLGSLLLLSVPLFFLLQPLFIEIDNPYFMIGYLTLTVLTFGVLELFNHGYFKRIVSKLKKETFIFNLSPLELIYLQKKDLSYSIHGVVNELVKEQKLHIATDYKLKKTKKAQADNLEAFQIINTIQPLGSTNYPTLLKHLVNKPVFVNISDTMNGFKQYFKETTAFRKVFTVNFFLLSVVFLLGLTRLFLGVTRDKSILFIGFVLIVLLIIIVSYLNRLTHFAGTYSLPKWYENMIGKKTINGNNAHWDYFLYGTGVFTASFIPLTTHTEKNGYLAASSTCGTSCGSSCGGGCGGGCGGCGG